ncbi:Rhodanese-related sulfurtransferase [Flavobacteriaceae bacterium MAR_2010_188]|nr:Rhodanese-related sulfurtransferase [Flavobacteriaceae bacterium MAR_2010_188]
MKYLLILFITTLSFTTSNAQVKDTITVLNAEQFTKAISADSIQLLDVRTPEEFAEGHINDAQNINFLEPETFYIEVEKLDRSKPLYLYCRSGNRSGQAAVKLDSLGFKKIYDLKGGYMNYPKPEKE